MTGSIHDYDNLSQALTDWRDAEDLSAIAHGELKAQAIRCGMPEDESSPIKWVNQRLATYRRAFSAQLHPAFAQIIEGQLSALAAAQSIGDRYDH